MAAATSKLLYFKVSLIFLLTCFDLLNLMSWDALVFAFIFACPLALACGFTVYILICICIKKTRVSLKYPEWSYDYKYVWPPRIEGAFFPDFWETRSVSLSKWRKLMPKLVMNFQAEIPLSALSFLVSVCQMEIENPEIKKWPMNFLLSVIE